MIKVLLNIFNECRRNIITGLPRKSINRNKKGDLTKYFDKYIESIIISRLRDNSGLKARILSEELSKPYEINKNTDSPCHYIIIDPVDGSDNYLAGIPFVCMGIAVFDENKQPVYSFVGNYFSNDWIYADRKEVVFSKKNSKRMKKEKKLLIFTFTKYKLAEIKNFQKIIDSFDIIRSLGATIGEMMMVVNGNAEAFVDIRDKLTLENFAPFFLIAGHLNLKLTDEKGKNLELNDFSMTEKYKIIFAKQEALKKIIFL